MIDAAEAQSKSIISTASAALRHMFNTPALCDLRDGFIGFVYPESTSQGLSQCAMTYPNVIPRDSRAESCHILHMQAGVQDNIR